MEHPSRQHTQSKIAHRRPWPEVGQYLETSVRPFPLLWSSNDVSGLGYSYVTTYEQPLLPPILQPALYDEFNVHLPVRPIFFAAFMPPRATLLDQFDVA